MFWGITLTLPQRAVAYAIGIALVQILGLACPFWLELMAALLVFLIFYLLLRQLQKSLHKKEQDLGKTIWRLNCLVLLLWLFLGGLHGAAARWPGVNSQQLIGQTVKGSGQVIQLKERQNNNWAGLRLEVKVKLTPHKSKGVKHWQKQRYVLILIDFPKVHTERFLQSKNIFPGVNISFIGQIMNTDKPRNPGAFDYPAYLATQKIYCRIQADADSIQVDREGNFFNVWLAGLREDLKGEIQKYLPAKEAAIVEGCLLGNTGSMSEEDLFFYRRAGIAHLFAVSGTHGSMVFAIAAFCSAFWPGKKIGWSRWFLSIGMLFFYVALTGFPLSMLRTLFMAIIIKTAEVMGRKSNSLTALAAAFIILLWINPGSLQQAGFQLSFGVVLGLLRLGPWLKKWSWLRGLQMAIAAQLAGMPLQAFWFNQWQPLSVLINVVEMFIMGPLMVLSLWSAFISQISSGLASRLWQVCGFLGWWMHQLAVRWAAMPWASWSVATKPWPFYLIWGLGLWLLPEYKYFYLVLNTRFSQSKHWSIWQKGKKGSLAFLLCLILIKTIVPQPLEVVFLDVGEGDCVVIHTPRGKTWLIDGGGTPFSDYEVGTNILLPYLSYKGVNQIEGVFLTHHHQDHREGLTELLRYMPAKNLWMPPVMEPAEEDENFNLSLAQSVKYVHVIKTSQQLVQLEKGLETMIWWPYAWSEDKSNWQSNDRSLVIRLTQEESNSWLFTGDIELLGLKTLLAHVDNIDIQSTVLKLPHHGSSTSFLPEFYEAIEAKGVVVTGGKQKTGNLTIEVGHWFKSRNVPLWSTRHNGAIITIQKKGRMIAIGSPLW